MKSKWQIPILLMPLLTACEVWNSAHFAIRDQFHWTPSGTSISTNAIDECTKTVSTVVAEYDMTEMNHSSLGMSLRWRSPDAYPIVLGVGALGDEILVDVSLRHNGFGNVGKYERIRQDVSLALKKHYGDKVQETEIRR